MKNVEQLGYKTLLSVISDDAFTGLTGYQAALRSLSSVHDRFTGPGLHAIAQLNLPNMAERYASVSPRLTAMAVPAGMNHSQLSRLASRLERAIDKGPPGSWNQANCTLLHGDLHPGNIWIDAKGSVLLMDWGEALIGPPAWDLALLPQQFLDAYLAAVSARGGFSLAKRDELRSQIRWATLVRAAFLLDHVVRSAAAPAQALYAAGVLAGIETALAAALPGDERAE
jgi:aminoglycoside phosphotransferase (APT) family kinase protein